ncbi:MAG: branched-chain amino acid ABC transporter substrate-binding protein [Pseudomonadota bacterium]|nr:branched-chain amino acid ABC transporter substrate-binding protein [Pseudomonadota bacterium]
MLRSLCLTTVSLALLSCGRSESGASGELVVKIGASAPLTGPQANLGKDNENGTRMAIDDLNGQNITLGGRKVRFELVSEDDAADPKTGTIVAQKFADQKVNGVIGHLNSGTSIPASRIYSEAGIPQISPSATNPKYTHQGFKTAFRVMTNDSVQGSEVGRFVAQKLGVRSVAVIDDATQYGQGLASQFEDAAKAAGVTIATHEHTDDKATDFQAILTNIKARNPDLIYYAGMSAQGGPMMKQLKALGIASRFMTGDGGCSTEFLHLSGAEGEGAYCSLPGLPLGKMPKGADFKTRFNAKYGDIQSYSPYCYDAVMVMVEAMRKADSADPAKYLPFLAKTDYEGVTSHIAFDANGDIQGGVITVYQDQGGKWVPQETLGGSH